MPSRSSKLRKDRTSSQSDYLPCLSEKNSAEKAVLQELARHSDWDDGTHAHPGTDRLARRTSFSARTVIRTLQSLACDDVHCGRDRCTHRGLIAATATREMEHAAMYSIDLSERGEQSQLPEVGALWAENRARGAENRARGA